MALNIKKNLWNVHARLAWLYTSPVSLVRLGASKKEKNVFSQSASESTEMSNKSNDFLKIILISAGVPGVISVYWLTTAVQSRESALFCQFSIH